MGFSPLLSQLFLTEQVYILFVSCQWVPEVSMAISQATFSFDGQAVYASFVDGAVAIFDTLKLQMRCRINPSAYLSTTPR